jgi:hypothetical protein
MQFLNLIFAAMLFVSAAVSSGAQSQSSNIFSPLIFTSHTLSLFHLGQFVRQKA